MPFSPIMNQSVAAKPLPPMFRLSTRKITTPFFLKDICLAFRDGDGRLTLEEAQQPLIHLFQFLAGKPGRQTLGIDQIVSGFEKLGESSAISESLRQLLTPVLETYPR